MKNLHLGLVFIPLALFGSVKSTGPERQSEKAIKPALLVIDIQNEYLPMIPEPEGNSALQMINLAIQMFREFGLPVIRIYNTDLQSGPKPDTEAFGFPASVDITPQDPKIVKNYPNAFKRTDLDQLLHRLGCNTLFLCGLNAVYCVLATYRGAADLDYEVFILKNAVMSHKPGYAHFVEDIFDAVGLKALRIILKQARAQH